MPAILDRLVSQLQAKGHDKKSAFAIATRSLQRAGDLKPGTQEATPQGARRGAMGAAGRAKLRAARAQGGKSSDYIYSSKTNRARKA